MRAKGFLLRSTEFRWSVFYRVKDESSSHRRGVCVVPRKKDFPKIQEGRFREIKVVGFKRLPTHVSRSKRYVILPTLAHFPSLDQEKRVFRLKAYLAKKSWIFGFFLMFLHLGKPQFA